MNRWLAGLAVGLLLLGGWMAYRWLFPPDEVLVRRVVKQACNAASWGAGTGALGKLAGVDTLAGLVSPDVEVLLNYQGPHSGRLRGRDEIRSIAAAMRLDKAWLKVDVEGMEASVVEPGLSATAVVALVVTYDGGSQPLSNDFGIDLRKIDGDWLITRVEPIRGFGM